MLGVMSCLTYICDASVESPSLVSVPIIYEFPNIFPTDLPGLHPNHDIEFIIDLEMGTDLF